MKTEVVIIHADIFLDIKTVIRQATKIISEQYQNHGIKLRSISNQGNIATFTFEATEE
jgi:hypothetical protein